MNINLYQFISLTVGYINSVCVNFIDFFVYISICQKYKIKILLKKEEKILNLTDTYLDAQIMQQKRRHNIQCNHINPKDT